MNQYDDDLDAIRTPIKQVLADMEKVPLPEQDGWALDMHGAFVSFANNAERAAGFSPGCSTQVFSAAKLLSHREEYAQAQIKPLVEALRNLLTAYHEGRLVVDSAAAGYVGGLIEAAESALAVHSNGA